MSSITVTQFLIQEEHKFPLATGDLTMVLRDIVTGVKAIAQVMRYGHLSESEVFGLTGSENLHGESQRTLDVLANEIFLRHTAFAGHVAGMVSEEMVSPRLPDVDARGRYLLLYDPVDGSSNLGEDTSIGTIFSILRRPDEASGHPSPDEFLQPGTNQVCAGYALYGPSCMLVMTTGNGVNGFTLDPGLGEFILTHPNMTIPERGSRLCVNPSQRDWWPAPVRDYIADLGGSARGRDESFDLRWSGCAVADVHRILRSGGIYVSPVQETPPGGVPLGKLRLLYEVNPLSLIVEQAGGMAMALQHRVLDREPGDIHERSPVILGSKSEVNHLITNYSKGVEPG